MPRKPKPPIPPPPPPTTSTTSYGTLITNVSHLAEHKANDLTYAMTENFGWADSDLNWTASQARSVKSSGLKLMLEPGFHRMTGIPPYIDQNGATAGRNLTWNPVGRLIAEHNIANLAVAFGGSFASIDGLRLGAGGDVEVLYPGGGKLWAYDSYAQAQCPYPNLRPGQSGNWRGFLNWYLDSLVAELAWRLSLFTSRGFTGQAWAIMPGLGTVPSQVQAAINSNMTTYMDPLGRGAAWDEIVPRLKTHNVGVWESAFAEDRMQTDYTRPGDELLNPIPTEWAAHRRKAAMAKKVGLPFGGENPGYGDSGLYGTSMLHAAVAQCKASGALVFQWAHDHNLYDGTAGFTVVYYGNAIK